MQPPITRYDNASQKNALAKNRKGHKIPLAVTMIVKDEERGLSRTLDSLIPLCPAQVIVGDTGSEDKTKEIADFYGCCVVDIPWGDHFAEARNMVLQHLDPAIEWCMWIDGDEELINGEAIVRKIEDMKDKKYHFLKFTEPPLSMYQLRLWRRNIGEHPWRGRVHEKIHMDGETPERHPEVSILQYSDDRRPEKLQRNMRLLQMAMDEDPENQYNIFHAAVLSNMMEDHDKSEKFARRYLLSAPKEDFKTKIYMQYLLAWNATFIKRDYQEAVNLLASALCVDPCAAELWCLMGDVYWWINRKQDAFVFYENAIELGKSQPESFWLVDLRKYDEYPRQQLEKLKQMNISRPKMPKKPFGHEVPV